MTDQPVKVLYISGYGRSGSTILGEVLGQIDGVFFAGELCYLWARCLIDNRPCSCGRTVRECVLWKPVLERAFGSVEAVDPVQMNRWRLMGARERQYPLMLLPGGRARLRARLAPFLDNLARLYGAIRDVTGCRLIVDSSKFPSYGYVLGMIPALDVYALHMVRDPRAAAYSRQRTKIKIQHGPIEASLRWVLRNVASELIWRQAGRYWLLRYEDFVAHPQQTVADLLAYVGEDGLPMPFGADGSVDRRTSHVASGNPLRYDAGPIRLQIDDEWKQRLSPLRRMTVTALTWPWLLAYRYLPGSG